ncbi:MAG: hypothetical protein J5379_04225 [Clostridiales bacterium]|nr:hypothetical protein [Clostridiales bacterium]
MSNLVTFAVRGGGEGWRRRLLVGKVGGEECVVKGGGGRLVVGKAEIRAKMGTVLFEKNRVEKFFEIF